MNFGDNFYNDILDRIVERRENNTLDIDRLRNILNEFRDLIEERNDVKISKVIIKTKDEILEKGDCQICFEEKCNMESNCNHNYCENCIKKWIMERYKTNCPFCRQEIKELIKYKIKN